MTTSKVSFSSQRGEQASGEWKEPETTGKLGGVVVIQEWWGLNDHVRSWLSKLASENFIALAPDLYHGRTTKDPTQAAEWMQSLDTMKAVDEIAGAVRFIREHARCNGRVAVLGFCMGGALTFASACHIPGLAAAVPFYGIPAPEKVDYAKVTAPILAHFAKRDGWAKPEKAQEIAAAMKARGQSMELLIHDADHAFMNDTRPEVFSPDCAREAWTRTLAFLHQHLDRGAS